MTEERELQRHNNVIEQIKNAETKDDLPNISYSKITSYLAANVHFNKQKISKTEFKPIIDKIIEYGYFQHPDVRKEFFKVVLKNYPDVTEEQLIEKYNFIEQSKRIGYLLQEISQKNEKLNEIIKRDNLRLHEENMRQIRIAFDIKDLPRVGVGDVNRKVLRAVNDNDFNNSFKTDDIRELTEAFFSDLDSKEVESIVDKICSKEDIDDESKSLMREQIISSLISDETILYAVEEIKAKEQRKLFIYKNDHEHTMEGIKEARRISQLPPNLSVSNLTSYLNGNTTIYSSDNRIKVEDLKQLTELLLDGHKWEDDEVKDEIKDIVERAYPDKEDAYQLLFNKLSTLPRTYYLVEEINYSLERQKEFIGNRCSNVNVYFIPNDKSPIEGGRFYNCYINRVKNLDLTELLPLNLDEIVPPSMDIDSVEWFVREKTGDDTFKTAGGIILNKDETIGNVNVFRPNDGKIGVTPEEKAKMDKIDDLDKQIQEKEESLKSMDDQLKSKEKQSVNIEQQMKKLLHDYEMKALSLQKELLNSITELKKGLSNGEEKEEVLDYDEDTSKDDEKKRGLK